MSRPSVAQSNARFHGFMLNPFPYRSAATPPTCRASCRTCSDHYHPLRATSKGVDDGIQAVDDNTARVMIKDLVTQTQKDLNFVRHTILNHGNAIIKKWEKSGSKRKDILKEAKPDIYPDRDADIEMNLRQLKFGDATSSTAVKLAKEWNAKHESTRLVPYLDLPSLRDDSNRLLALMNNRAFSRQSDWVLFDSTRFHADFHACRLHLSWNPHCVVMFGDRFGTVVKWDVGAAHRWDILGFAVAHLVLQAQNQISTFLRKTLELLLGSDLQKTEKGFDEWTKLAKSSFKDDKAPTVGGMYCNAFTKASTFTPKAIRDEFNHQGEAAHDEVVKMQTDPIYARHILDRLKRSRLSPTLSEEDKQNSLFQYLFDCIERQNMWQWLQTLAAQVTKLEATYDIRCGKALPKDYADKLKELEANLTQYLDMYGRIMKGLVFQSPAFHKHYSWVNGEFRVSKSIHQLWQEDKLFFGFYILLSEKYQGPAAIPLDYSRGFDFLVGYLEPMSDKSSTSIDQKLYTHLSDMGVLDHALYALKSYRPRRGHCLSVEEAGAVMDAKESKTTAMSLVHFSTRKLCRGTRPQIRDAMNEFMDLPLPSKWTENGSVEKLANLHRELQEIWRQAYKATEEQLKEMEATDKGAQLALMDLELPFSQAYEDFVTEQGAELQRTVDLEEKRMKEKSAKPRQIVQPECLPSFGQAYVEKEKFVSGHPKLKVKTRPSAENVPLVQPEEAPVAEAGRDAISADEKLHIAVSAESMEVFSQIFATSMSEIGRVRTVDFVRAMVDAGCTARHGFGSAWTFEDVENKQGSLTIHMPHTHVIEGRLSMDIRVRLERRLNWDKDTFVDRK